MANERVRSTNIRGQDGWTGRTHPLSPNQKDHETTQEWETILSRFDHRIENFIDFYGTNRGTSQKPDLPGVEPTQSARQSPHRNTQFEITQLLKA